MRKFLKNILIAIAPALIFVLLFDLFLRNTESAFNQRENELFLKNDQVEILILGNSHAQNGVNPSQFKLNAFNLAQGSQSIYFDKRLTQKYFKDLPKLKYVLISIDYHSLYFSSQGETRNNWTYFSNGIKYDGQNYFLQEVSPFLFGYTPKVSVSLLKKKVVNYFKKDSIRVRNPIHYKYCEGTNELSFNSLDIKKHAEHYVSEGLEKAKPKQIEVLSDLEDFIRFLKKNGVMPILFATPCYSEFNSYLNKDILANNKTVVNSLCDKFDIKYLDFSHSNLFMKNDFYNSDHMNLKGGTKFAKILNDSIIKMEHHLK